MRDKDLLNLLGLNDRTITLGIDEDIQILIEHKIDNYLKRIDEEKEKQERINAFKNEYEDFKRKEEYLNKFNDKYIYNRIKNKLIQDGFIYQCPFCRGLDVSGQYAKRKKDK